MNHRLIAFILTISMLAGLLIFPVQAAPVCSGGSACPAAAFRDVPGPDNWAHEGIDFCVANGIMNGTSAAAFSPNDVMTRAMVVTVLYRQSGSTSVTDRNNVFTDVKTGQWYSDAVIWANKNGIVNGTSATTFSPDAPVTREQLATILMRYANTFGHKTADMAELSVFPDAADADRWAQFAMRWAVAGELIRGKGSGANLSLSPRGNATRAEVATILMRFIRLCDTLPALDDPARCPHDRLQTIAFAATCTSDGGYLYYCPDCASADTVSDTPAPGHNYVKTTVPVTCTQDGCDIYTCTRCGDSYSDVFEYAPGHDMDDGGVCRRCGKYVAVLVYSMEGEVGMCADNEISFWLSDGWLSIDSLIPQIQSQKLAPMTINDILETLESGMDSSYGQFYSTIKTHMERICAAWKTYSLYPMGIVTYSVETYNGSQVAWVYIRNLSGKKVNTVYFSFYCLDANGNPVKEYGTGTNKFLGYYEDSGLQPCEGVNVGWELYGYERTTRLQYVAIDRIDYSDGTSWYRS